MQMKRIILAALVGVLVSGPVIADYHLVGRYLECSGETESGVGVTGECYMYSSTYGDLEGVETDRGEEVTGECYWYGGYAEFEGAETDRGEEVTGECQ